MKVNEVPQDITYYEGEKRACYALNDEGKYVVVKSTGWEAEDIANGLAVTELAAHLEETRKAVLEGKKSPLCYHMERRQMNADILGENRRESPYSASRDIFVLKIFPNLKRPCSSATRSRWPSVWTSSRPCPEHPKEGNHSFMAQELTSAGKPFSHLHSAHCESGVTAALFRDKGINISEAMAFGIGSGIFFGHLPFIKWVGLPITTYRSRPGTLFSKVAKRLGGEFITKKYQPVLVVGRHHQTGHG
jgi:hypothetical protein